MEYTAIIKKDHDLWIGWIKEIPGVNCQEKTRDQLIKSLKITLKEAIEFTFFCPPSYEINDEIKSCYCKINDYNKL